MQNVHANLCHTWDFLSEPSLRDASFFVWTFSKRRELFRLNLLCQTTHAVLCRTRAHICKSFLAFHLWREAMSQPPPSLSLTTCIGIKMGLSQLGTWKTCWSHSKYLPPVLCWILAERTSRWTWRKARESGRGDGTNSHGTKSERWPSGRKRVVVTGFVWAPVSGSWGVKAWGLCGKGRGRGSRAEW